MSEFSVYPDAIDGYSQLPLAIDTVTPVDAISVNRLRCAIVNIEKELGVMPSSSSFSDVKARLDAIESSILTVADSLGVEVRDEGSSLGTACTIDFVGDGVVATFLNGVATVTVDGSGSGGGTLEVQEEGGSVGTDFSAINFIGDSVIASDGGLGVANITITDDTGLENVVEDLTPQLGGGLGANGFGISYDLQTLVPAPVVNIDWNDGNKTKITLDQNVTFTFTAPPGATSLQIAIEQDGIGGHTITWPAAVLWRGQVIPSFTTTASGKDVASFYYDGTNYLGVASLDFG